MDSFLEEPRTTPRPTPIIQGIETPTVPEVSLMFQNSKKDKSSPQLNFGQPTQSYNAWKLRNNTNNNDFDSFLLTSTSTNKENLQDKSFLSKKQVRFESPIHKTSSTPSFVASEQIRHLLPSPPVKKNPENKYLKSNEIKSSKSSEISKINPTLSYTTCNSYQATNPVFQSTSSDTLKRLETLGINKSPQEINESIPSISSTKLLKNSNSAPNTFEKIYCSAIPAPNKELDLSFLEPQKVPCPRQEFFNKSINNTPSPKHYKFSDNYKVNSTKNDKPHTILSSPVFKTIENSYPKSNLNHNSIIVEKETVVNNNNDKVVENNIEVKDVQNKSEEDEEKNMNTSEISNSNNNSKETVEGPSVNDLLQIIKLQNEQLQRLQNQVEMLVKISENNQKSNAQTVESKNKNVVIYKDQQVGTSFTDEIIDRHIETKEETVQNNDKKISVGMMTSFQVSFKPPVTKKSKTKSKLRNLTPVQDISSNNESFIETHEYINKPHKARREREREETRNQEYIRKNHNENEREFQNTWNNNRKTNVTEYSLDSEESLNIQEPPESPENSIHIDMQEYDTESEDSDDECSTDTGWTFYKDILGQVNNLLGNSNRPTYRPNKTQNNKNAVVPTGTDITLEQIKENALKRLQNDGFLESGEQCSIRPNEVSFAVKQILMKYLPDDGLAEAVTKNTQEDQCKTEKRKPTDISVTAVKYMQQCNVVTNSPYYGRKPKLNKNRTTSRNKMCAPSGNPKILDITTLKQQPKLL